MGSVSRTFNVSSGQISQVEESFHSDRGAGPTLLTGNCGSEGAEGWGTGGQEGLGEKDLLSPSLCIITSVLFLV